jgi:sarcosine oxidase, subunit delta
MKLMPCPINGLRPVSEFRCSDAEWTDYVFNRNGSAAVKKEWWLHIASGIWFVAERDTATDRVLRTYIYGEAAAE